jgi:TRAP-type C4-dicarboxylate transport system substrate-binding protein
VGIGELGFRQISNNVRPILEPSDLQGIKLRTPGNPFRIAMFKAYGANPTPISGDEVYMALRQGVVDGQENPLASIWGYKWHEVQNYVSMSNHVFTPTFVGVSRMHWDTWPPDVQQAIREAVQVAADYSFKLGEEKDNILKEQMKEQNPNIQFNDVDIAAFKKASEPLYAEMEAMVGEEIWTKATNALQ